MDRLTGDMIERAKQVLNETRSWPAEEEPTALEWASWFQSLDIGAAEVIAQYVLSRQENDDQCFLANHVATIAGLESTVGRLQAEIRRMKGAEIERARQRRRALIADGSDDPFYCGESTFAPPKIYLAARYSRNEEMRGIRDVLVGLGFEVTSRWIDLHPDVVGDFEKSFDADTLNAEPERCAPLGRHDLDDIDRADWVVSFTCGTGGKGGRHVEYGYALAKGKLCFVVGPREHVFHTLLERPGSVFPVWPAFALWVSRYAIERGMLAGRGDDPVIGDAVAVDAD